jgi:methylated-DNA-[protein]-cysteine S-methyltransferase
MITLLVDLDKEGKSILATSLQRSSEWELIIRGKAKEELAKALELFFSAYKKGVNHSFPWEFLAHPRYPAFTLCTLQKMHEIPFGKTLTYAQLAEQGGSSKAARAAGSCCRKNRFPLLLPCHRIVSLSGCGPYSQGDELKPLLLKHEGVLLKERN